MLLMDRLFGRQPHGDSCLTAYLEEALERPGCPICCLVADATRRGLEFLLYGRVNDPVTAQQLLASRGFCGEHTWAAREVAALVHASTGVARLYQRLLADLLRHADSDARFLRWLQPDEPCPLCAANASTAAAYLAELARLLAGRSPRLGGAAPVLCLPHLAELVPCAATQGQARLAEATEAALGHARGPARLALAVGRRPLGGPPASCTCPACLAAREASAAVEDAAALCRPHAWQLFDRQLFDRDRCELAGTLRGPSRRPCPACRASAAAVETAIDRLDDARPLCLGHLRLALESGWVIRATVIGPLEQLGAALGRQCASADYRFAGRLDAGDRQAWLTALACFGGEVVGAGLGRPPAARASAPSASGPVRGALTRAVLRSRTT